MPLGATKASHTSSELVQWMVELDDRANQFNPLHYYLAQVACEMRRSYVKKPSRVKLKHFIFKFEKEKKKQLSAKELKAISDRAKLAHFKFLGLDADGNPVKK